MFSAAGNMLRRFATTISYRNLSTQTGIVKSRFPDVDIPKLRVDDYVFQNIEKWAEKTALECLETGRSITYQQLQTRSLALARFLRGPLGMRTGDTIAVVLNNIPEYAIPVLGGSAAGLKVTTINPLYTPEEIKRQLVNSDAKLVFTMSELWTNVSSSISAIPGSNIPVVMIKHKFSDLTPRGVISFEETYSKDYEASLNSVDLKDTFLLPYSSGTTGLPKGVALTHYSIVANFCQLLHPDLKLNVDTEGNQQDVLPLFLPMFHLYGLVLAMTDNPAIKPKHLKTLRSVMSAAAPLGAADVERFHKKTSGKIDLVQLYGLTEASPALTAQTKRIEGGIKSGGSGLLVPNTECMVVPVDDITHPGLGPNETGELLFRGPQNMKGYHNNEQATRDTFVDDGWMKTGDIGYYDDDGHFFITDRLKELIKVKGFQVAPAELEEILRDHPAVADAAVIGVPDAISGEVPKAFVVLKNKGATKKDINDYVNSKVTDYKKLRGGIEILDSIPKTTSGKILRRQLK